MKMMQDETRKGPWTEQEDILLINFVNLFGDRRWDFIAKVSGLKVAGDKYRWSRIARKLPGRTDNEIKNYWRTHTRKKAQERKSVVSPSLSSSNCSSSSNITTMNSSSPPGTGDASFYDTGGLEQVASAGKNGEAVQEKGYSMDDIWRDIENTIEPVCDGFSEEGCNFSYPSLASPLWEYCPDMLWSISVEESKMFLPYDDGTMLLTG
ncbi:hypothetical protein D5086_017684 [Populus alba]|uniref:Uncharacterized protein n=1 Tax=Populus alba TaxID=43335 RepID=A0ACC4BP17_POPAL